MKKNLKSMHIPNHGFDPLVRRDSEILILGSFPSVKSREQNFFYMHKQNRFWKLLEMIYEDSFTDNDIQIKTKLLIKYKIALYDVIESCDIIGSKDSSITNIVPVDISLLIKNTNIERIYLNGKKANQLFLKYNPELVALGNQLPSTSSANATYSINKLYNSWKNIINNG